MSRRWIAVPAAALLALGGVTSAGAVDDGPEIPTPDEAVVVSSIPDGFIVAGIEVSARALTWSQVQVAPVDRLTDEAEPPPGPMFDVSGRGYTPDLGQAPLRLGGAIDFPLDNVVLATSSDRWVIGIGPPEDVRGDDGPSAVLYVKPAAGGATRTFGVQAPDMERTSVALWGDTALAGNSVVNLATGDVTQIGGNCLDTRGAVLADGVLLFNDLCDEVVLAADVSADGFRVSDLAAARPVADEPAYRIAYSRGMIVMISDDDGSVWWGELDEDLQRLELDAVDVRAHGERFVVVVWTPDGFVGVVFDTRDLTDIVAIVPLGLPTFIGEPRVTDLAASPGGEMPIGILSPIDLFGRTLAWGMDGTIYAMTLPALAGGSVSVDAPAEAMAGKAITVTGSGFAPLEEVAVWLNSSPQLLGMGQAGADGSVSLSVTIPAGAAGAHTLVLHGVESGWDASSALAVQGVNPGLEVQTG